MMIVIHICSRKSRPKCIQGEGTSSSCLLLLFSRKLRRSSLTAWPIIKHFPSTNKINSLFSLIRQTKTSAFNVNNKLAQQLTLYCVIFYYQASLKALFNTDYLYYAHLSRRLLYKSGSFFPIHERRIMLLTERSSYVNFDYIREKKREIHKSRKHNGNLIFFIVIIYIHIRHEENKK